jgi:hypothetical protein
MLVTGAVVFIGQPVCLERLWQMTCKDAQRRRDILRFWQRHGTRATVDAFDVSRRTP